MLEFKNYLLPLNFNYSSLVINCYKEDNFIRYNRELKHDKVSKILNISSNEIIINPITTSDFYKKSYNHLLIQLTSSLVIEKELNFKFFVTFPICIGVFINSNAELIDCFSLNNEKFSLFGDIDKGIICRWHSSDIYNEPPKVNSLNFGIMEINTINPTSQNIFINQLVFDITNLNLYYSNSVFVNANIKLISQNSAETYFSEPAQSTLSKALDIINLKKLGLTSNKFIMENLL